MLHTERSGRGNSEKKKKECELILYNFNVLIILFFVVLNLVDNELVSHRVIVEQLVSLMDQSMIIFLPRDLNLIRF